MGKETDAQRARKKTEPQKPAKPILGIFVAVSHAESIHAYLATRPYSEVGGLCIALENSPVMTELPTEADAS